METSQTQTISGAVLNIYKYLVGVKTFIGQATTDSNGYTYFNMDIDDDYIIIITKDGYVTQTLNSIPLVDQYTILLNKDSVDVSYVFSGFSYKFTPSGTYINNIPFNGSVQVIDEDNTISISKFTITGYNCAFKVSCLQNFSEYNYSIVAGGDTITHYINDTTKRYRFNLTVVRNNISYTFIKDYYYINETTQNTSLNNAGDIIIDDGYNGERMFIMIIGYLIFSAVGASLAGPGAGAILGLFPLVFFFSMGWLNLGVTAVLGMFTLLGVWYFRGN
jgi:hypothetical protein